VSGSEQRAQRPAVHPVQPAPRTAVGAPTNSLPVSCLHPRSLAYAGGSAAAPPAAATKVAAWLEWEERVLRPAALQGQPAPLTAALTHLAGALAGSDYLAGTTLTVADAAVYATLLPLTVASSAVRSPQGGLVASEPAGSPPCAGHAVGLADARVSPRR